MTKEAVQEKTLFYKMRKLLIHGSFVVVGASVLIAGGVSSHYHPHVDPEEYGNCTDNSSYYLNIMS